MSIEIKVPPATRIGYRRDAGRLAQERPRDREPRREPRRSGDGQGRVGGTAPPVRGVLQEIKIDRWRDGHGWRDVLAILEEGDAAAAAAPAPEEAAAAPEAAAEQPVENRPRTPKTSPAVRRLLDEHDLDATMVTGTGKDGRVTKADVMAFLKADDVGQRRAGRSRRYRPRWMTPSSLWSAARSVCR